MQLGNADFAAEANDVLGAGESHPTVRRACGHRPADRLPQRVRFGRAAGPLGYGLIVNSHTMASIRPSLIPPDLRAAERLDADLFSHPA